MKLNRNVLLLLLPYTLVYSQTINVTTNFDSGAGTLRQAITDINSGSDSTNVINLTIENNKSISLKSDLPVIKKNTVIKSTTNQLIDGNENHRLFATIMADLTLNNCTLQNGAAIGGSGGGGGMGAGGGIYIDRGNTLTLINTIIKKCKAQGGEGMSSTSGGGASFSTASKNSSNSNGGGDYPGLENGSGGAWDGSKFLSGYGGGGRTTNNGRGTDGPTSEGGYCGGQGSARNAGGTKGGGGGGNGGGTGIGNGGGGGFGSGGAVSAYGGGGGFGGGGSNDSYGGFGGGGGRYKNGGLYGGNGNNIGSGGGAGIGGGIFIGDSATCIIEDDVSINENTVVGGSGENAGQGYAPDIFLFRQATLYFNNSKSLDACFAIQGDQFAPICHLDNGIIKTGIGQLTLVNTANNYQGGTVLQEGTLCIANPKVLGCPTSPIVMEGGTLQVSESLTLPNPIIVKENSALDIPDGVTVRTMGNISGNGTIHKTSAGIWDQYGECTDSIDIEIARGLLHAHGILSSRNIEVSRNAIFQGCAMASGNVRNDGLIKPCSDNLGSLIIEGNYTQTLDGALNIQFSPNGTCDTLQVQGMSSLDGTIQLNFLPGIYPVCNPYKFIQASSIKGIFAQITSNKPNAGIIDFETDGVIFTFLTPQIVLSVENDDLPNNQKHIANYLFSDGFPAENKQFVDLLQTLFTLPINEYEKALASLTPEIYGALPLTQNQTIYYITSLPAHTSISNKKNTFAVTPFYNISYYDKEKSLPNYQYNAVGFSINVSQYVTSFTPGAGLTYYSSDTAWQGESGRANTFNIYLYPSLTYHNENLFCNVTVLGGYTYHNVNRTLQFGDHIHIDSTPHSWELATALHGGYTCNTEYVTFTPQLNFTQVNVFQSSIKENKPEDISLKTASKNFRYLNMSLSLKLEQEIIHSCCCITPSLQFGWHNTRQLSDKNFNSKIGGYSLRKKYFRTETYGGNTGLYFLEGGLGLSDRENSSLKLSYRAEFDTHVITSGLSAQIVWEF